MNTHIKITVEDAKRIFEFLEKTHELMHQPLAYRDPVEVEKFVEANYAEVKELYYRVVWRWLPDDVRQKIEDE